MHLLFTSKIYLERALFIKKNNLNNHPQSEINNKNIHIQNIWLSQHIFPSPLSKSSSHSFLINHQERNKIGGDSFGDARSELENRKKSERI